LKHALVSWRAFLFGLLSILIITPWTGRLVLMSGLQPAELAFGLAVFCTMPTSLSANIALSAVRPDAMRPVIKHGLT
jgi:solute carrier family 10 (sodium/bile acid cotransporter), member 7